ncbi:winged helix-turn-helix domain-containing protein, partial [Bacillus subtilis]
TAASSLRTVDTHIKTLRLKLNGAGRFIETVWGVGYKFGGSE